MIEISAFYELLNKSNCVLVCDCMKMWVDIWREMAGRTKSFNGPSGFIFFTFFGFIYKTEGLRDSSTVLK